MQLSLLMTILFRGRSSSGGGSLPSNQAPDPVINLTLTESEISAPSNQAPDPVTNLTLTDLEGNFLILADQTIAVDEFGEYIILEG